eukprot:TRINITY_DN16935_c0_g1_i1.p1 TRINITY_DN16935_c0_g1~~TRINITY_DN16935_c0_g1_i1.p1  ORF type:complete len:361 (+),score=43.86 TRINITY_DN16935_c0_g1_i1:129-1211(+)
MEFWKVKDCAKARNARDPLSLELEGEKPLNEAMSFKRYGIVNGDFLYVKKKGYKPTAKPVDVPIPPAQVTSPAPLLHSSYLISPGKFDRHTLINTISCDFEIIYKGESVRVHKAFLIGVSGYFDSMLSMECKETTESRVEIGEIERVTPNHLRWVLNYIYGMTQDILVRDMMPVIKLAKYLQLEGATGVLQQKLTSVLSTTNAVLHYPTSDEDLDKLPGFHIEESDISPHLIGYLLKIDSNILQQICGRWLAVNGELSIKDVFQMPFGRALGFFSSSRLSKRTFADECEVAKTMVSYCKRHGLDSSQQAMLASQLKLGFLGRDGVNIAKNWEAVNNSDLIDAITRKTFLPRPSTVPTRIV